jgi:hypothetical protein
VLVTGCSPPIAIAEDCCFESADREGSRLGRPFRRATSEQSWALVAAVLELHQKQLHLAHWEVPALLGRISARSILRALFVLMPVAIGPVREHGGPTPPSLRANLRISGSAGH